MTRITDTLHADQYTFMIISRSVLRRMRNAADKNAEKIKTHFMFSNFFFSEIVPFMTTCKNMVEPNRPQVTQWLIRIAWYIHKVTNTHSE